ncbi:MAG: cation:proton antiporter [Candidatus ainarchaeum sp.]|nr:cation:proton antiporter [Candidatus ainarchaeum sp.]
MDELFFVIGLTIFVGFLATLVFERTRISQVLLLMLFGFVLGPVLHLVDVAPASIIVSILPFVATLALIVLLFDAGLMIDVFAVARAIPRSLLFTCLVFTFSIVLVAAFTLLLGWPLLYGVLLGAVLGGTSSAIVVAMVEKAKITKEARSILTLESTITDALCILVAVTTMQLILSNQPPAIGAVANLLLSSFSVALLLGVASAVLWVFAIGRFTLPRYTYMLTLALVFGLYAVTNSMNASGGFAVFVFGMVLGNVKELQRLLHIRSESAATPTIQLFQEEITFFVRTFFFVYIGLLLSPAQFTPYILGVSMALLALFVAARWAVEKVTMSDLQPKDRNVILVVLPRGLAAAVLATLPLSSGISIPGFQQIVFSVILFTNIVATAGIFVFEREKKEDRPKPEKELAEAVEETEAEKTGEKEAEEAMESDETEDDVTPTQAP